MPYSSKAQQRWAHTDAGENALGGPAKVAEWDAATNFKGLPERAGGNMKGMKGYLHRVATKRAALGTETPAEERREMSQTKRRGIKIRPANRGKKMVRKVMP